MPVQLKSRIPEIMVSLEQRTKAAEQRTAEMAAADARQRVSVRSGATRGSITTSEGEVTAAGAALYLEHGTVNMEAEPFLGPAADDVEEEFVSDVRRIVATL